jgi:acyl-coenzyme A thioesterase PaaI-like protein
MSERDLLRDDAPWRHPEPGRFIGRGHPTGDFLEAHDWRVLEARPGYLKLDVHLPAQVQNLRGQLFGGFSPTYVDLVALRTANTLREPGEPRSWHATLNMHVDYLGPVLGPRFLIESEVLHARSRTYLVETRFSSVEGALLLFSLTTIKRKDLKSPSAPSAP